MKTQLKNVRISYPDIFHAGGKFSKFGAQFRFSKEEKIKEQLEDTIDQQGTLAFAVKWPAVKKELLRKGKMLQILEGKDKGYEEDYYINLHTDARPLVVGKNAEVLAEEDNVIYSGCRVNALVDVSAYLHKEFGPIVSTKLLGVQFSKDDTPLAGGAKGDVSDFDVITEGPDDDDIAL
jgi:hypothetical protein